VVDILEEVAGDNPVVAARKGLHSRKFRKALLAEDIPAGVDRTPVVGCSHRTVACSLSKDFDSNLCCEDKRN